MVILSTVMALLHASRNYLQLSSFAPAARWLLWGDMSIRGVTADAAHTAQSTEGTTDPLSRRIVAEHNKIEGWFREYERAGTLALKLKLAVV